MAISFAFGDEPLIDDPFLALKDARVPHCRVRIGTRLLEFDASLVLRRLAADCALQTANDWNMPETVRDILESLDVVRYAPARHFLERDIAVLNITTRPLSRIRTGMHVALQALNDDPCVAAYRTASSAGSWSFERDVDAQTRKNSKRIELYQHLITGALWVAGFDAGAPINARLAWCREHRDEPELLVTALMLWEQLRLDGLDVAEQYLLQ